jgi:hypothetical protein
MHKNIMKECLHQAIFDQSENKAPGPDRINLKAIRMIWNWEPRRIMDITRRCLRIRTHPTVWKVAKGVVI